MKPLTNVRPAGLPGLALIALAALPLLGGCISSSKVTSTPGVTIGQQLIDLDKAYSQGVITKEEYDKLRKEILKRNE
jgi:hypothetical protein